MPTPVTEELARTGKNVPRTIAVSRSSTRVSMGTSSPPRYRSIKVSSSLSEMMPSMSSPRTPSAPASSAAVAARTAGRGSPGVYSDTEPESSPSTPETASAVRTGK
ncbi:hypothetical protein AHiyo1_36690 [Arthrobacter sp. Hiyo1]|nr:hypothetical protein AHiyo1_36690 [Arthrobacter sp. Hiyo1]